MSTDVSSCRFRLSRRWTSMALPSALAAAALCAWSSHAVALDVAPACDKGLAPVYSKQPVLPRYLHNEHSGEITTHFTVLADGSVHNPIVFSARWRSVGKSQRPPKDYEDAVIKALSQWRYPRQREACLHEATISVRWQG